MVKNTKLLLDRMQNHKSEYQDQGELQEFDVIEKFLKTLAIDKNSEEAKRHQIQGQLSNTKFINDLNKF